MNYQFGKTEPLKVFYKIPYVLKDDAKSSGLRWDPNSKRWYTTVNPDVLLETLDKNQRFWLLEIVGLTERTEEINKYFKNI
jgi:hypothetical protein